MRTALDHSQALTIDALAERLLGQKGEKVDYVADTRRIGFFDVTGGDGASTGDYAITLDGVDGEFRIRDRAHKQIAGRLKIPRTYYDRMRGDAPELLKQNVEHWLRSNPEKRMWRTLGSDLRAVLSDRYLRLDHDNLVNHMLPVLGEFSGLEFFANGLTDEKMFIRATLPRLEADVKVGDTVRAGVEISNSEVGSGALQVRPFILRLQCLNGMVSMHKLGVWRRYHVGRQQGEGTLEAVYQDETLQKIETAIFAEAADLVRASLSEAAFNLIVSQLQDLASRDQMAAPVAAVEVLRDRLDLTEDEGTSVLNFLAAGGDLTQWGAINAITETAKRAESFDRLVELEETAGRLAEYSEAEWARVAVAA